MKKENRKQQHQLTILFTDIFWLIKKKENTKNKKDEKKQKNNQQVSPLAKVSGDQIIWGSETTFTIP